MWSLLSISCDPSSDIARLRAVTADGKRGVPCKLTLLLEINRYAAGEEAHYLAHFLDESGKTDELHVVNAFAPSGRYLMAVQCEGYEMASYAHV